MDLDWRMCFCQVRLPEGSFLWSYASQSQITRQFTVVTYYIYIYINFLRYLDSRTIYEFQLQRNRGGYCNSKPALLNTNSISIVVPRELQCPIYYGDYGDIVPVFISTYWE